ncbi:hypothetical protein J2S43_003386 [Catenuloplanes nepalensis]|uniref:Uncharacterized protein n=1 Tax=Catenuloplanes nepalensis TaxID=587533 RepID=A0ABT9MTW4_9ACTN|nr:hypothetical protein [Catenuloplanes nepalensis]MDP9794874.1 hypothetical protein [Catenuloplanes nepalensis]
MRTAGDGLRTAIATGSGGFGPTRSPRAGLGTAQGWNTTVPWPT